jgi:hypothetical protein
MRRAVAQALNVSHLVALLEGFAFVGHWKDEQRKDSSRSVQGWDATSVCSGYGSEPWSLSAKASCPLAHLSE